MKVAVTGATGFIGRGLCAHLLDRGDEVIAFTRDAGRATKVLPNGARAVEWTPTELGPWEEALEGAHGVVHLASEPYTQRRMSDDVKRRLLASHSEMTRNLVRAMGAAERGPGVFVAASAITIYGERGDEELDEGSPPGDGFWPQACLDMERGFLTAEEAGIRTVLLRIGFALEKDGGLLQPVIPLFKAFVGGRLGNPAHWISWIHCDDLAGFVGHALSHDEVRGAYNLTAPNPARTRDFFASVGRAMRRPCWFHLGEWVLRPMLGEAANILLLSTRALPRRTTASHYTFQYPELDAALQAIFRRQA
jgi:uncharacterized protein (TIGR01777 family)